MDDIESIAIKIHAGILLAHGGDDGNAQFSLDCAAERAGCHAVAAGIEAGAGDKQIHVHLAEFFQDGSRELVLMLDGVIITADKS